MACMSCYQQEAEVHRRAIKTMELDCIHLRPTHPRYIEYCQEKIRFHDRMYDHYYSDGNDRMAERHRKSMETWVSRYNTIKEAM